MSRCRTLAPVLYREARLQVIFASAWEEQIVEEAAQVLSIRPEYAIIHCPPRHAKTLNVARHLPLWLRSTEAV